MSLLVAAPIVIGACEDSGADESRASSKTVAQQVEGPAAEAREASGEDVPEPHVRASSPQEAGRYLVVITGCNDCHTEGYRRTEGDVPESEWLTGSPMGWRGPWGTTYGSNLRLYVAEHSEEEFVDTLLHRKKRPPMPWMSTNHLHERDARAIYAFIEGLGPAGKRMPARVPPGEEPKGPYISMTPESLPAR